MSAETVITTTAMMLVGWLLLRQLCIVAAVAGLLLWSIISDE